MRISLLFPLGKYSADAAMHRVLKADIANHLKKPHINCVDRGLFTFSTVIKVKHFLHFDREKPIVVFCTPA